MESIVLDRQTEMAPEQLREALDNISEGYIFIAGPTCSGKTTLSHTLGNYFWSRLLSVSIICQDDYFKDLSDIPKNRSGYLTDGLSAFHTEEMIKDLTDYDKNGKVQIPMYDIATNSRLKTKQNLLKTQITIVEGLHTIHLFHNLFKGIYIYVDTPIDICLNRRIARDTLKYRISMRRVVEHFYDCIMPLYNSDILPQREFEDVITYEAVD